MGRKKQNRGSKVEFQCWCGCEFRIVPSKAKHVLSEFEMFCSEECLINYINNVDPRPPSITRNSPHISDTYSDYDPVTKKFYRSGYEVVMARCLANHDIEFEYEAHSFFLNGRYYTPDFYIPEAELYIECKGLWKGQGKQKFIALSEIANIILLPSYFQDILSNYKKWDDVVR